MTANTIKLLPVYIIDKSNPHSKMLLNRVQLSFMLPSHEYGCVQYTNYYTDTMRTLKGRN